MRFLAGAGVGLLFAVAIVLGVNTLYPGPPTTSFTALSQTRLATMTSNMTSTVATTTATIAYPAVETNTAVYGGSVTSSATTTQAASPPSPTGQGASIAAKTTPTTGSIVTTLIGTLPPIAIALVLGILVYQLSTRRVDAE